MKYAAQVRMIPVLAVLTACVPVQATDYYVDATQSCGAVSGTSWSTAFKHLTDALEAVRNDTSNGPHRVFMKHGTYKLDESCDSTLAAAIGDDPNATFNVPANTLVLGGYDPADFGEPTVPADRADLLAALVPDASPGPGTVLDGEIATGVHAYHIMTWEEPTPYALLYRVSFVGGNSLGATFPDGAGLRVTGGQLRVGAVAFLGCVAETGGGGGVAAIDCDVEFTNCHFAGNVAFSGGGALVVAGEEEPATSFDFLGCNFEYNVANEMGLGGGLLTIRSSGVVAGIEGGGTFATANGAGAGGAFAFLTCNTLGECEPAQAVAILHYGFKGNRAQTAGGGCLYSNCDHVEAGDLSTGDINSAAGDGGCIAFEGRSLLVRDSTLLNCQSDRTEPFFMDVQGGAISCRQPYGTSSTTTIKRSILNGKTNLGGCVGVVGGTGAISHSGFCDGAALFQAGACLLRDCDSVVITNCQTYWFYSIEGVDLPQGGYGLGAGAAVVFVDCPDARIEHCTVRGFLTGEVEVQNNMAGYGVFGVGSDLFMSNSIVWNFEPGSTLAAVGISGGSLESTHCQIQVPSGGSIAGSHTALSVLDPEFAILSNSLTSASPCISTGDTFEKSFDSGDIDDDSSVTDRVCVDFGLNPRVQDCALDRGALEFPGYYCPADFNCEAGVTAQDLYDFYAAWFSYDPRTDSNCDGVITVQDLYGYYAAWAGGCS